MSNAAILKVSDDEQLVDPSVLCEHYCVLDVKSNQALYPFRGRLGINLSHAAAALVPGTVYGVGLTPETAREHAERARQCAIETKICVRRSADLFVANMANEKNQ